MYAQLCPCRHFKMPSSGQYTQKVIQVIGISVYLLWQLSVVKPCDMHGLCVKIENCMSYLCLNYYTCKCILTVSLLKKISKKEIYPMCRDGSMHECTG